MIARECAALMARQIVRALHIPSVGVTEAPVAQHAASPKRKPAKPKKKRKPT